MASLTSSRNTPEMADGGRIRILDVEAATTIYLGSMVAVNAAGRAVPASSTTSTANPLRVIGRAEYVVDGVPGQNAINPGAAGATRVAVRKGVFLYAQDSSIGAANLGAVCFAIDDNSVTANDRANGASVQQHAAAGEVVAIEASGVWVDFWHQAPAAA